MRQHGVLPARAPPSTLAGQAQRLVSFAQLTALCKVPTVVQRTSSPRHPVFSRHRVVRNGALLALKWVLRSIPLQVTP